MKNFIQRIVRLFKITIHRTDGRGTLGGALKHLKKKGLNPNIIIDGGASDGRWIKHTRRYFPYAHAIVIEPLTEYLSTLHKLPNATVVDAALADKEGEAVFYHTSAFNSSLTAETGEERRVKTLPLDSLLTDPEHTLVKLDLEGGEHVVLASSKLISHVPVVIVECAFPNLPRYSALMEKRGFIVHEIYDLNFDRATHNMSQVDIVFVQKNSTLR